MRYLDEKIKVNSKTPKLMLSDSNIIFLLIACKSIMGVSNFTHQ